MYCKIQHGDKLELLCPVLVNSPLFLCYADKQAQLWVAKIFPVHGLPLPNTMLVLLNND